MRKFKLLALALVIGSASLFASTSVDANAPVPKEEIRSQIVDLLHAPEFAVSKDITVNLTFTFSSEGEIVVLSVGSLNRDVRNYIRKNLNYKKIDNPGERDQLYDMSLKVKKG